MIPEKYSDQRPPLQAHDENGPSTPPGSPPHDAYDSVSPIEGEGEAAFTGSRVSPPRGLSRKMLDSKLLVGQKRTMGAPPLGTKDNGKRMKPSAPEAKPRCSAPLSPQPQRPPPPRRNSSNAPPPPPPPKPVQAAQKTPQKPSAPKPAPPRRQNSNEESLEKKQTPQKVGTSKPVPWQSSEKASAAPSTPQQQELKNPAVKPNIKMPDGWSIVWSKSQKRWYFYNMISQKSVWEYDKIK